MGLGCCSEGATLEYANSAGGGGRPGTACAVANGRRASNSNRIPIDSGTFLQETKQRRGSEERGRAIGSDETVNRRERFFRISRRGRIESGQQEWKYRIRTFPWWMRRDATHLRREGPGVRPRCPKPYAH